MKDSFILYTDQRAVIEKLTDEQAGKLIKAIYQYTEEGTMPELDTLLEIAIIPIKQNIDKNNEKWEEERQKRSEAGRLGGLKKAKNQQSTNSTKQSQAELSNARECQAELSNAKECLANQAVYVNVNDNVNVINKDKLNDFNLSYVFDEKVQCDCMAESTDKQCERIATYRINGRNYCNQHSKGTIVEHLDGNKTRKVFVKPTVDEVRAYCQERKNDVDAESFIDFYQSKGWKVGNAPMKDWKACVRTWEKRAGPKRKTEWELIE